MKKTTDESPILYSSEMAVFGFNDGPFLHYSSVARVKALALAGTHELIDTLLPDQSPDLYLIRLAGRMGPNCVPHRLALLETRGNQNVDS